MSQENRAARGRQAVRILPAAVAPAPASARVALPAACIHEGAVVAHCAGGDEGRHVRRCDHPGEEYDLCTRQEAGKDVDMVCDRCPDHTALSVATKTTPPPVAPLQPAGWQGKVSPKPHEYALTVAIPHLDTPDQLRLCLDLWRCQTMRPYLVVVDTGSPWKVVEQLDREVRAPDCEVHFVRAHAYRHSSAPVSAALDLAQTLCRTDVLFHTHSDVFPLRRDFLAFMLSRCSAASPVVGWQMSPRDGFPGAATRHEWEECVSHTATALHMPTVRAKGLWWAFERYYDQRPEERGPNHGWPDTESPFLLAMRAAGVAPVLLGPEGNFEAHDLTADGIAWAVHARSYTGLKAGAGAGPLWEKAKAYMARAESNARLRLAAWRAGRPGG